MRPFVRRGLRVLLVLFILLNIVAAMHAWRFTHFEEPEVVRTREKGLSFIQKVGILLTGVHNPKPVNRAAPDTAFQRVSILSDVAVDAWWIPVSGAHGSVLLCHGYGGAKAGMLDKADAFRAMGYSTLLIDFRGAGGSPGNQCTIGWKESIEVRDAVQWLRRRDSTKPVILFGTSMGAAAIMKAAADSPALADRIIIECPFGSMTETVKNRFHTQGVPTFPMAYLLLFWGSVENGFNAFAHNPEAYAARIKEPTLLLWGEKDEKVSRSETNTIFRNLAGPKRVYTFPEAGHENYLRKYYTEWNFQVAQFLGTPFKP
jgi:alpha-beta hydrolase superfamily lysophospholipase